MKIYFVLCYLPYLFVLGKVYRKSQLKASDFVDTIDIDSIEDALEMHSSGDDIFSGGTKDDDDHDDDEIFSGEGATAVSLPVVSACQTQRREANARNSKGAFIPRCTPDGQYKPVQCHARTGDCWCVDKSGRELLGSRRMAEKLDCSSFSDSRTPAVTISVGKTTDRRPTFAEVFAQKSTAEANSSTASPSATAAESRSDEEFILIQTKQDGMEPSNRLDPIPNEPGIEVGPPDMERNGLNSRVMSEPRGYKMPRSSVFNEPGILAGIIGGAVVGLLCAVLLVMFIIYHMRRKEVEPVFMIDRPSRSPSKNGYTKAFDKDVVYT